MATINKKNDRDNQDDDQEIEINVEMIDGFEKIEIKLETSKNDFNARRRLEELKDDKIMKRLLSNEIDDWYNDLNSSFRNKPGEIFYDDPY